MSAVVAGSFVVLASPAAAVPAAQVLAFQTAAGVSTSALDGTGVAQVAAGAFHPKVSPDGTKIAYTLSSGAWIADINGANPHQLTQDANAEVTDWSPDSTKVVLSTPDGIETAVVSTLALTAVPNTSDGAFTTAYWSPDNTLLIYGSSAGQVVIRPDGTSKQVREVPTGAWSPAGSTMVALSDGRILSEDVASGTVTDLGAAGTTVDGFAWLSDGSNFCKTTLVSNVKSVVCPGGTVANASEPSVGGGTRAADGNGAPGQVTLTTATAPGEVDLSWVAPASTPDYAGVEVRYALGSTPPSTVTAGTDGGRLLAESSVIKGLAPDQPVAISVFTRDWFGNVSAAQTALITTPHQTISALTGGAVPFDFYYRTNTNVHGVLSDSHAHTGIANATLTVGRRPVGSTGSFTTTGTVHTNASGAYSFSQVPSNSAEYKITYAGDSAHAAASAVLRVRVAHISSISVSNAHAKAGTRVNITATPAPNLPNGQTWLAVRTATGGTARLGPHATNSAGTVIYTVTTPAKGKSVSYRVEIPGSGGYIDGGSPFVTITGS
jgi:hypothetical protein